MPYLSTRLCQLLIHILYTHFFVKGEYMIPFLLEFLGTMIYIYIRLYTQNPILIGITLTTLLFIIQEYHSGSFNPALDIAQLFAGATDRWYVFTHFFALIAWK